MQGARERIEELGPRMHLGQIDEVRGERRSLRELPGQAGLAHPARADERYEPVASIEAITQRNEVLFPTKELRAEHGSSIRAATVEGWRRAASIAYAASRSRNQPARMAATELRAAR